MTTRHIELLETAYDLDIPVSQWVEQLCGPLHAIHAKALGTWVFEFDRRAGDVRLGRSSSTTSEVAARLERSFDEVPLEHHDLFFSTPLLVGTGREQFHKGGFEFEGTSTERLYSELGYHDTLGMAAIDPVGVGIAVGTGFREAIDPSPGQRQAWMQISAHLAAAHRLRRKFGEDPAVERADAILSPNGKLEHVADPITSDLREQLAEAVERVEHARTRARDIEEALSLWRSLVAGEWSLADHFEGSGRRYYVAVRNPPEVAPVKALTRREAEVVAYLALGTKTQAVAYALGVDEITVRGYLKTALAKLGLRSRAELIEVRAMLQSQAHQSSADR